MIIDALEKVAISKLEWYAFDLIFMASGFEARSSYILKMIPAELYHKCVVLGFPEGLDLLSREENDLAYKNAGLEPFVASSELAYEGHIKKCLYLASTAAVDRPLTIFVDYSVMTRAWYACVLNWIKYSGDIASAKVLFAYTHGLYEGIFQNLQIADVNSMSGFEGVSAGSRQTVVLYGLGYDKFATLAVHELMEPDRFICFIADSGDGDKAVKHVMRENAEMIAASGTNPIILELSNLSAVVNKLDEVVSSIPFVDEVVAVPMGPKTHVLATLLLGQKVPRLICMHPRGIREKPVQVRADGEISCWLVSYKAV